MDDDSLGMEVDPFIGLATQWPKTHIGRPSKQLETEVMPGAGCSMIDCGVCEGCINEKIMRAVKIARAGKEVGATHVSVA